LWPLFHYFLDAVRYEDESYEAYQRVNRMFARHIAARLKPDDLIWIHDYHMIPLAQHLRDLGVHQPIGFFLHIPFPHIEALRALPVYGELMRSFMDYDFIGLQTERDLECFRSAVVNLWSPRRCVPTAASMPVAAARASPRFRSVSTSRQCRPKP
jgi:trehalose 6-phosphate synthase